MLAPQSAPCIRWPLVPCTVLVWDSVYVQGQDYGPLQRTVRIYSPLLVLRSLYARYCAVFPPLVTITFLRVQVWTWPIKILTDPPPPSSLLTLSCPSPPLIEQGAKQQGGFWHLRSISTPVGCVLDEDDEEISSRYIQFFVQNGWNNSLYLPRCTKLPYMLYAVCKVSSNPTIS